MCPERLFMAKYIAILTAFMIALLSFAPVASAEGDSTFATSPVLADTETNAIIGEAYENISDLGQVQPFDDGLVHLFMPTTLDFYIDPMGILGLGSVYSRDYSIQNLGGGDAEIVINDAAVIFANEDDFEAMPAPFDSANITDKKAIYLELNFSREDIPPIIITNPESPKEIKIDMPAGGEPVLVRVTGLVNPNPVKSWQSGDVKINLSCTISAVAPEMATPAALPPPTVASPGDTGPWEPIGGEPAEPKPEEPQEPEPQPEEPWEPQEPEPQPRETWEPEPQPQPEEPQEPEPIESPQPPEATSGVI
jgi:hypothetical protein